MLHSLKESKRTMHSERKRMRCPTLQSLFLRVCFPLFPSAYTSGLGIVSLFFCANHSFSYLQMKHILFAWENTACKHEKTTNKIQKILPENPGNILRGKALENRKTRLTWRYNG